MMCEMVREIVSFSFGGAGLGEGLAVGNRVSGLIACHRSSSRLDARNRGAERSASGVLRQLSSFLLKIG